MKHFVVQLALTLAGAYLSFYVANGPCEFSGEPPFKHCLLLFVSTLLPLCALIMPTDSFEHHSISLMTLSSHLRQAFGSLSA